ncbi:MAG: alanine racemase [Proteobacteria bacterium]|nr:alanine racemase [Pseudomonadota bacterium]
MAVVQQVHYKPSERADTALTTSGPPELESGGVLTINLRAIEANWRTLAGYVSPSECAAVVKADAYGCGIEPVTAMLSRNGCRTFFVAHPSEARRVRAVAPASTIYVLNGIVPGAAALFAAIDARPVIGNLAELAEWDAFTSATGWRGGAALHFDTGMRRLGLSVAEAAALLPRVNKPDHGVTLIMSHFACAEDREHPLNTRQTELFRELRMMYRGIPASLANSYGIFLGAGTHCDMVRAGAALYGINPTPGRNNPMRPTVELAGRIVQINTLARGETIGYGATWTAKQPSRVAIVSVGYADGYMRGATAAKERPAQAIVAGLRCALVGRISMDLLAVDITAVPVTGARRGGFVTLLGGEIGVEDLAASFGTIGYEVLTNLGRRHTRKYHVE